MNPFGEPSESGQPLAVLGARIEAARLALELRERAQARTQDFFHWHHHPSRLASGALMKWPSVLLICALALLSNACEQHKASELEEEHGTAAHAEAKHDAPAGSQEKKAEDGKPGEAPKFFPEKK